MPQRDRDIEIERERERELLRTVQYQLYLGKRFLGG